MNFFGHALAASWRSREPGFALGSMLPDFASMCGMRLDGASDAVTAAVNARRIKMNRSITNCQS